MVLSVNEITKSFGEKQVLKGVSLEAEGGKALGILGRNGAGKTTMIRIIMGVFGADSGSVAFDGKPIDRKTLKIGYLPEERGLYPKKKIMDQLIYFAGLQNVDKKTAVKTADELFKKLEIEEYKNVRLDTLSKGNQQKIQLIATLITNPDIVILDEPFSGLDPVNASMLKDIVKELIADGKLVLFSSHQMNYVEEFCNDIVILNGGQIVLSGSIRDIKRSYARDVVEITSPKAISVAVALKNNDGFIKNIKVSNDTVTIKLENGEDKQKLIRLIAQSDVDIDEIKVKEPTLNEIFVNYTEGGI